VIGHARSTDLIHWEVLPSVVEPGDFGHMEVPQLVDIQGRYYLLFSVQASIHASRPRHGSRRKPFTGIYYLTADDPLGPFRPVGGELLIGDVVGSLYAGKLVEGPDGAWVMLSTHMHAPDGDFVGVLNDPVPVVVTEAGSLSLWQPD
jgi:beta-fructofuranosidase